MEKYFLDLIKDQGPVFLLLAIFSWQVGPKIFEYLSKHKDTDSDKYGKALKSLQEYSDHLSDRLKNLEKEVEDWKNKYYEIYGLYCTIKDRIDRSDKRD